MKPSPQTRAILDALDSAERLSVVEGVERAGEELRAGTLRRHDANAVSRKLVRLASTSRSWEVKKAIADASPYLTRNADFATVYEWLSDEREREFVRDAAERARKVRDAHVRTDLVGGAYGDALNRFVVELERDHGRAARRSAEVLAHRIAAHLLNEARHEVTNAVSALSSRLKRAGEDGASEAEWKRIGEYAHERATDVRRILDRYCDLTESAPLHFGEVDLFEAIAKALDTVASDWQPSVDVEVRLTTVEADPLRLAQALTNVIKNAYESYGAKSRSRWVEIRGVLQGEDAVITVKDRGAGIPEEDLPRIMLGHSRKPGGRGIGVPMLRKIIEMEHNGDVTIRSRKGKGTTVTIRLPVKQPREDDA